MFAGIVTFDQSLKYILATQRVGRGEITIHTSLQGAIEPFHHGSFGISVRGKMMNLFLFQKLLERYVVKFFATIRL